MRWLDSMLRFREQLGWARPVDPHIVLVGIDTDDLDQLPEVSAEYQNAADIIIEASELGASVIVLDIVFARGSRENAEPILESIDRANSKNCAVVLAEFWHGFRERKRSFPFTDRLHPSGLVNVETDSDGVLRHYAFLQRGPEGLEPSLALTAYLTWRNIGWSNVKSEKGSARWSELSNDFSKLETRKLSADRVLLDFRVRDGAAGPGVFRSYTRTELKSLFAAARQNPTQLRASPLENRVLFVSVVAPGAGDVATTPLGKNQPKVLVHATALNDLIQKSSIQSVSPLIQAGMLLLLIPLFGATRLFRGSTFPLLFWIAGCTAILLTGFCLLITTHHLMESVYFTGVWTILVFGASVVSHRNRSNEEYRPPILPPNPLPPESPSEAPIRLVYSYSHKDDKLCNELETHLALLKRQGVIASWYDRRISAGEEWKGHIDEHFREADIILLLVSADFLSSNYCYDVEMKLALERHRAKEARVIPIILRDVDWNSAPFGKIQALPKNGRAITSWKNRDEAWAAVAREIRKVTGL